MLELQPAKHRRTARRGPCVIALALAGWAACAQAEPAPVCTAPDIPLGEAFHDRTGVIARMQALPDHCLKGIFLECERASADVLDLGSAATCSMNYEALLRKSFAGDFNALLVWWRQERDAARTRQP